MKKSLLVTTLICIIFFYAGAQTPIEIKDAASHIGDSVTLCGKIYGGIFLDKVKNQPTFLNMGAAYPNQLLTVVIWGDKRKLFNYKPEEKLKNKEVCITGRIEEFKGKPQIVIQAVSQIQEK